MITFAIETIRDNLVELQDILPLHYQELALNQDKVPLSPQYDVYLNREDHGGVLFVTARDKGELIGYFIGFIANGLHYSTCLTCTMDIFYIHPNRRGSSAGYHLFKFVENELKRRKVDRWFVGSKVSLPADWLFEKLDFERVEVYYTKWLGE